MVNLTMGKKQHLSTVDGFVTAGSTYSITDLLIVGGGWAKI